MKLKNEFCPGGRGNYVQKILSFAILNKVYFVVARSAGLVQLYEKAVRKPPASPNAIFFKLVKEWKNSTAGPRDPVVAIGSFRNQYMYTCSSEGKLVIRDLINDDADDSVKSYLIDGPVSCVEIKTMANLRILVAAGGRNNELKMYDLNFGPSDGFSTMDQIYSVGVSRPMSAMIRVTNVAPDDRMALRRNTFAHHIRSSFSDTRRLVPVFSSSLQECVYSAIPQQSLSNWILSVCFIGEHRRLCAGTQFGKLMVYDINEPCDQPLKVLNLSQFPVKTLHVFSKGRYLLYADTMSKVGVVDVETMEVVNFYDFLKIGPTVTSRVYTSPDSMSKVSKDSKLSKFLPVYIVATTIDGTMVIYRLCDSNESELKLCVHHAGVVPNLDILDQDAYSALESAFGLPTMQENAQEDAPAAKRRKAEDTSPRSQSGFLLHLHSPSLQGSTNNVTTTHEQNDRLVNEIKTMKIVN